MMASVKELLELVKAASGPDHEIDRRLFMFERVFTRIEQEHDSAGPRLYAWSGEGYQGEITSQPRPTYTASIDASLALTERLLPDTVRPGFQQNPDRTWNAAILRVEPDDDECPAATGPTAPLAILTALLTALSTKEG